MSDRRWMGKRSRSARRREGDGSQPQCRLHHRVSRRRGRRQRRDCARGAAARRSHRARTGRKKGEGATVYVTLEPCAHESPRGPACTDLLLAAKPARVVIALKDPDPRTAGKGIERLRAAGIDVKLGVGREAAKGSLSGWLTRLKLGRPRSRSSLPFRSTARSRSPRANPNGSPARMRDATSISSARIGI